MKQFLAAVSVLLLPTGAVAQNTFVIEGRVLDRESQSSVTDASIAVNDRPAVLTTRAGTFRLERLSPGEYTVRVYALGYVPAEVSLILRRDTTLMIHLAPSPFSLDSLRIRSGTVVVEGRVVDSNTGTGLVHVEVISSVGEATRTDGRGRFRLIRYPLGSVETVLAREIGYLQSSISLEATNDTTIELELHADALAQRMIAAQIQRLDRRWRPFRSTRFPVIPREQILWMRNATAFDIVKHRYGHFINGVRCIMIDEVESVGGLDGLTVVYAGEIERIEVLMSGAMLRIYTRDFLTKMMAGGVELQRPIYAPGPLRPLCR